MQTSADVLVVGAGVHGASVAFNLVKLGDRKVLMVDKEGVGSGATGRSASFVRHHYSNEICVRIVKESRRVFQRFGDEVGQPAAFHPRPLLIMVGQEHEEALRQNVALHRSLGVDVDLMEPQEVMAEYGHLDLNGISLAAIERDAGFSDAYEVNAAYAGAFRSLGGSLLTGVKVTALKASGGRIRGAVTTHGEIEVESVVLATGPWSRSLAATVGVDLPVEPALISVGIFRPTEDVTHTPMAFDMTTATYWRPEVNGTLLVGTDEETGGSSDPDRLPEGVAFGFISEVVQRLSTRWPAMADARFLRGWVGVDGDTPDLHPIVGPVPKVDGLYVTTGYSGHGFKFSPAVGRCLAELILDGRYRTLDLTPFRLERFAEGKTFSSRYPVAVIQ